MCRIPPPCGWKAKAGLTAVPTDPYGQQQDNQLGQSTTTENLVDNYPDRAWCKSASDDATSRRYLQAVGTSSGESSARSAPAKSSIV